MSVIDYGWKLQHKIEFFFKDNVNKFGKRFIMVLFFFSILVYGLFGFIWIQYIDGIPTGFDNVLDFILNGKFEVPLANPVYPVFFSIACMIIMIKNEQHRIYGLFCLLFGFFILFYFF